MSDPREPWFQCPLPMGAKPDCVSLVHGEGGRLSRQLIRDRILARFRNDTLHRLGDAALLPPLPETTAVGTRWAFTSDGYTVSPLIFPGGDIGRLAVFGTVNDLAVSGAVPHWLSLCLIIEEGLPLSLLDQILDSVQTAAELAQVEVVTGDTKVVPRGAADGLYLTTSGIGALLPVIPAGPESVQPGDEILVSGPIGCHGAAILCAREQWDLTPPPVSDCAPLTAPLRALLRHADLMPRAVRDATRGGVAAVLQEWAAAARQSCTIIEDQIPLTASVRAVSELLGLDPLHLANEGTFVLATHPSKVPATLDILRQFDITHSATVIGRIGPARRQPVSVVRVSGREVALEDPAGMPLPRIC